MAEAQLASTATKTTKKKRKLNEDDYTCNVQLPRKQCSKRKKKPSPPSCIKAKGTFPYKQTSPPNCKAKGTLPNITLYLAPTITLSIWRNDKNVCMQIFDGHQKIDIPPHVWRVMHMSAEGISLLLSFVEGQHGMANFYQTYYNLYNVITGNENNNNNADLCADSPVESSKTPLVKQEVQ